MSSPLDDKYLFDSIQSIEDTRAHAHPIARISPKVISIIRNDSLRQSLGHRNKLYRL